MKPFDLEAAKAGAPVCTRDGYAARIICTDANDEEYPIVALITCPDGRETPFRHTAAGSFYVNGDGDYDLFMASVKKEGWVNLYKQHGVIQACSRVHKTEEDAIEYGRYANYVVIATVKIGWEE